MRHSSKAIMAMVAIVLATVLSFAWATSSPESAQADPSDCIIDISGVVGIVICGGEVIGQLPLPQVTVRGPNITLAPLPPVTIRAPRQTVTVTVRPPAVTVPGTPGATITQIEPNGSQETVTVGPSASPTSSQQPVVPRETTTITVSPTGQSTPSNGTVSPDNDKDKPDPVNLGDGKTTIVEAGLGLLTILALCGLLLIALYTGYTLGYKDRERKDTGFMRALLEQTSLRRNK